MSRQAHITLGKKINLGKKIVSEYLLANVPENAFVQFFKKKKKKILENKKLRGMFGCLIMYNIARSFLKLFLVTPPFFSATQCQSEH